ncbi:MAG: DUF502 domain-containing protein [Melioribacteraceae bacterium]|nr:DUF502 domain-containing protein [Melioribacteraceae bacterium]
MSKFKIFIRTTLFGGFLVVLPIIVLIFVLKWFFDFLTSYIRPITNILIETANIERVVASLIAIVIMLIIFFMVGLVVQTKIGKVFFEFMEERFLRRVPLYKIIKETVIQLFGGEKILFKGVALVRPFGNDTLITAFITDQLDDYYTVFVPSAPAPTGGYIYHLHKDYVTIIDYPVEEAMRTVLSLGAGSKELLNKKFQIKSTEKK